MPEQLSGCSAAVLKAVQIDLVSAELGPVPAGVPGQQIPCPPGATLEAFAQIPHAFVQAVGWCVPILPYPADQLLRREELAASYRERRQQKLLPGTADV
jgi:hypothetical protein